MLTNWNYEAEEDIPPAIAYGDALIPANVAAMGQANVDAALDAATDAARDYCGWHVAPSVRCSADLTAEGCIVRLPATFVGSVDVVRDDGTSVAFEWLRNGLVRRADGKPFTSKWGGVHIEYSAGLVNDRAFAAVLAQVATNALAVTPGVRQEGIGNASKTYNSTMGEVGGVALSERAKACLAPYRVMANAS